MPDLNKWIEHLDNSLVLVGFAVMLFTGIIYVLVKKDVVTVTRKFSERMITYGFVLSVIVVILGFTLAFVKEQPSTHENGSISQKSLGAQSPPVVTDSDVNITFGETPASQQEKASEEKTGASMDEDQSGDRQKTSGSVSQSSEGSQSPPIVSGGDVNITFDGEE